MRKKKPSLPALRDKEGEILSTRSWLFGSRSRWSTKIA